MGADLKHGSNLNFHQQRNGKRRCGTYIYTILAIEENKTMSFAATWMDLEIIILSQTEKDNYHTISLICGESNF